MLYAEPLSQGFVTVASRRLSPSRVQRLAGPAGEYLLFTLVAPIMAQQFPRFSLIANLRPQVALLSVAARERDELRSPETPAALERCTLLRTDQHGWIHLSTDGEQMWVAGERP